jgi:hypothetical protein
MAAQLQHEQRIVALESPMGQRRIQPGRAGLAVPASGVAAGAVDVTAAGCRNEPGQRVVRKLARPLSVGVQERVLDGVFADVELAAAVTAQQPGEDLWRQVAPQALGQWSRFVHPSPRSANITGRISRARPGMLASGICKASSTARASFSTSIR